MAKMTVVAHLQKLGLIRWGFLPTAMGSVIRYEENRPVAPRLLSMPHVVPEAPSGATFVAEVVAEEELEADLGLLETKAETVEGIAT